MTKVAIVRLENRVSSAIDRALGLIDAWPISEQSRIVIKPNVCNPRNPCDMVNTSVDIVEHVVQVALKHSRDVTVVESDNISGTADYRLSKTGFIDKIRQWGVRYVNLSRDEYEEHEVDGARIGIPRTVLDCDYFINLPKMKTCAHTLVTLSLKNLFGVIVNPRKNKLHRHLDEILPYLAKCIRNDLIIVDGIVCMEGNGPVVGSPKQLDLIVAGTNPVDVDTVCSKIMGFEPSRIPHIAKSHELGLGQIDVDGIDLSCEALNAVCTRMEKPYSLKATIRSIRSAKQIYL